MLSRALSLGFVLALLPLIAVAASSLPHTVWREPPVVARTTVLPPFFAAGDSAANIPLATRGQRVLLRWVARRSGRLEALHLQVKIQGRGYAAGSGGILNATTYHVLADGRPDLSEALTVNRFRARSRERGGSVAVHVDLDVSAGEEYATVIRNEAATPSRDYFSINFFYARDGVLGANGRNERNAAARDRYYRLDPRELVGYSRDGGKTWRLPGGPYGIRGGTDFLPTYVQEYAGGVAEGQFYYYSHPISGSVRMVYRRSPRTTITHVGAYTDHAGSAAVVLAVNGRRRVVARLSGSGFLMRRIPPVRVPAGATVTLTARAGPGGLALSQQFADSRWSDLVGLGRRYSWYLESDPETAVPLFPLPAWEAQ
jgi:hypothetical protein